MPIEVYDFHNLEDHTHVLVTPQIRARLLRIEPSAAPAAVGSRRGGFHTHDLGHEIFLILQGRCLMEIEDEAVELAPGQLCYARVDQPHRASVIGDEPVVMYLSVTPHIRPTPTWTRSGIGARSTTVAPTRLTGIPIPGRP